MANKFIYNVHLIPLSISNKRQDELRDELNNIPYLLYEVETLLDGRKIVINKPGGKRNYGRLSKNDFMVFIYTPSLKELWLISHDEIFSDIEEKLKFKKEYGNTVIDALEEVCNGKEPDDVIREKSLTDKYGLSVELLLKVYKWIWGQEDVNYPTGKGRWLSMDPIKSLKK
jgi:hypothetical protein